MSDVTDPEVRSKSNETEQDSREGIFNYESTFMIRRLCIKTFKHHY
ncbi:hypothetical protein KYT91_1875 (plasmid) [Klebsiella pneumoniae]|uniref:Uncharacterized protein n=1 Tax=Klebsiella pneumoniae subsp. pneumoniae TaxID=72407 RepID=A0A8F7KSN2_KLEPN|nr:hypothetical protein [Klebsiella pneumoniae subsp. pneumoniae]UFX82488.1 hypothetical protein KYT91_1875 [Klebsiella pneumoniae]URZ92998.1 hypothetical protein [Klebsiella pneumoniae]